MNETIKWILVAGAVAYGIYYVNQRGGLSGILGGAQVPAMAYDPNSFHFNPIDPNGLQFQNLTL